MLEKAIGRVANYVLSPSPSYKLVFFHIFIYRHVYSGRYLRKDVSQ